jgi:hypothetical protein
VCLLIDLFLVCVLQSPPKGGTIPYRPRPGPAGPGGMMIGQGGAGGGYGMQGNYGMNPAEVSRYIICDSANEINDFIFCFVSRE